VLSDSDIRNATALSCVPVLAKISDGTLVSTTGFIETPSDSLNKSNKLSKRERKIQSKALRKIEREILKKEKKALREKKAEDRRKEREEKKLAEGPKGKKEEKKVWYLSGNREMLQRLRAL